MSCVDRQECAERRSCGGKRCQASGQPVAAVAERLELERIDPALHEVARRLREMPPGTPIPLPREAIAAADAPLRGAIERQLAEIRRRERGCRELPATQRPGGLVADARQRLSAAGYWTGAGGAKSQPRCERCQHVRPPTRLIGNTRHDRRCALHDAPVKTHGCCRLMAAPPS